MKGTKYCVIFHKLLTAVLVLKCFDKIINMYAIIKV